MIKNNDKTLVLAKKITDITLFVLMFICALAGLLQLFYSCLEFNVSLFFSGLSTLVFGPVIFQFIWLFSDIKFNHYLDVKIIRDCCLEQEDLAKLPVPLFHKTKNEQQTILRDNKYSELLKYKKLLDSGAINEEEFAYFKKEILNVSVKTDNPSKTIAVTADDAKKVQKK